MDWNKKKIKECRDSNFFVSHAILELICVIGDLIVCMLLSLCNAQTWVIWFHPLKLLKPEYYV